MPDSLGMLHAPITLIGERAMAEAQADATKSKTVAQLKKEAKDFLDKQEADRKAFMEQHKTSIVTSLKPTFDAVRKELLELGPHLSKAQKNVLIKAMGKSATSTDGATGTTGGTTPRGEPTKPAIYQVGDKQWNGQGPTPALYKTWETTTEEGKAWRKANPSKKTGEGWPLIGTGMGKGMTSAPKVPKAKKTASAASGNAGAKPEPKGDNKAADGKDK